VRVVGGYEARISDIGRNRKGHVRARGCTKKKPMALGFRVTCCSDLEEPGIEAPHPWARFTIPDSFDCQRGEPGASSRNGAESKHSEREPAIDIAPNDATEKKAPGVCCCICRLDGVASRFFNVPLPGLLYGCAQM